MASTTSFQSVLQNRWFVLAASIWMESCAGVGYMYSLYSQNLKNVLGYNQKMIDTLGMAKDIGGNVGITSGWVGSWAPTWVVLLVGALENAIGYFMMWLALTKRIEAPAFWQMCIYIMLGTNGATFFNTAALVTCVKNYPSSRGPVVGLLKGYIGLGGAIFTQVYLALYSPNTNSFLLLACWLPAAVAVLVTPIIQLLPSLEEASEKSNFLLVLGVSSCLALYLLGASLLATVFTVNAATSQIICVGALVLLLLPVLVAVKQEWENSPGWQRVLSADADPDPALDELSELAPDIVSHAANSSARMRIQKRPKSTAGKGPAGFLLDCVEQKPRGPRSSPDKAIAAPKHGEDHTLLQAFSTFEFWLIYFSMTLASGSGLTAINNLGQIGRSLGYGQDTVAVLVSFMSVWNFFGRVGGGYIPEYFVREHGWPRPVFMIITQFLLGCGHVLFAWNAPGAIYIGSALVGLCYGAQWGLMPAVASEIFGLKSFGNVYNWLTITNPTGSYLLSVCVAGYLYDLEAEKEAVLAPAPSPGGVLMCSGPQCFQTTFWIMALSCGAAALASAVLSLATRDYYFAEFDRRQDEAVLSSKYVVADSRLEEDPPSD